MWLLLYNRPLNRLMQGAQGMFTAHVEERFLATVSSAGEMNRGCPASPETGIFRWLG